MPDETNLDRGEFSEFLSREFGPDLTPGFSSPIVPVGVVICFVNRSGSNYLAECLASSGDCPRAREHFIESNLIHRRQSNSSLSAVFESIVSKQSLDGIFATKLGYRQLEFFASHGFLDAAFAQTRFIFLKRQDVLAQAISLDVASQTAVWRRDDKSLGSGNLQFSRKRIALKMRGIRQKYAQFDAFFSRGSRQALSVIYEDFVTCPEKTLAAAGEFLDLPLSLHSDTAKPKSLDFAELKEKWKVRYLTGIDRPDHPT